MASATEQDAGVPGTSASRSAEVLQSAVDQAAYFNLFSRPEGANGGAALGGPQGVVGVRVCEALHRFQVATRPPTAATPLRAANVVGECLGRFRHRWVVVPDDFVALPGAEPPPTPLDPARPQRFVMLDGECRFGDGDGFRGFGTGLTLPTSGNGRRQLLATAIGTVLDGFGRFNGCGEGTYLYCGTLAPESGFTGNLMIRLADPEQALRTDQPLSDVEPRPRQEAGVTYVVFRGEAVPSDAVRPNTGPDGRQIGLVVEQGLFLHSIDAGRAPGGVQTCDTVGRRVGRVTAYVAFDPARASGAALDPVPFTAYDEFAFVGPRGEPAGGFTADSREGRVFNTSVLGRPAIRFGGVGRLLGGTGPFDGIDGLMTDNSLVVFTPHVSASVYVLRVNDPQGRFAAALGES
ncbi:MAG TPA: hypothetical protein VGF55_23960 [Gemmataceae bacterium]|jgi:hypothetical protein